MKCSNPPKTVQRAMQFGLIVVATATALLQPATAQVKRTSFKLYANPKFSACLGNPSGPAPEATVTVTRGSLADSLSITGKYFLPKVGFDLFTVERSELLADGEINPNFTNFGQAWYQTDLESDAYGNITANIKTILLDQIFGFDPDVNLQPTQALNVGFWFDTPGAAAACGFTGSTPFNGQHLAGPNAMISLPNATTGLGPLCTAPLAQGDTFVCNVNQ